MEDDPVTFAFEVSFKKSNGHDSIPFVTKGASCSFLFPVPGAT